MTTQANHAQDLEKTCSPALRASDADRKLEGATVVSSPTVP
ncbi:hypothetical protein ACFOY2_49755 [Nonomuraea purpurea]|uniref:Uncharacterized protein n=1 Tax=Nonomuraea purpurea TaxID=1849276 RepID=A0ABV8GN36_9ACTN